MCQVWHCVYIADATIDDFNVCALHDHDATRGILERLMLPGAFGGGDGRPMVVPVGPLEEEHLVPREAPDNAIHVWDAPHMADVPEGPSKRTHPSFDLTR